MQPNELRSKLKGVIGFPVTPFKRDLSLDLEGLRKNLRVMLAAKGNAPSRSSSSSAPPHPHPLPGGEGTGICAIVAAAGTGEFHSLSPSEHLSVLKATIEEAAGRVPVLTAVGMNPPIAAEMAKAAAGAGASGILAFPPYYTTMEDEGLIGYYKAIADATKLGLLIYSRDWFAASPATVEKLAAAIPSLIAWKDGQADIRRYQMVRQRVGDRLHWIGGAGDDMVPAYYSMGVRTYTSSISNTTPKLSIKLHEWASAGHSAEMDKVMNELIVPLYALRAKRKGYEVSAMKSMMDMLGLVGGPVRPPLVDLTPQETEQVRGTIEKWRAWV